MQQPAAVREREVDLRMGQRQPRDRLGEVAHLGLRRPQKLLPHRRVEEQVPHFDASCRTGPPAGRSGSRRAADDFQLGAGVARQRAGCETTSRLTSAIDASASPRKPSVPTRNRSSASRILLVAWLATASGNLLGRDAAAVVDDADQLDAALLHRRRRSRVAPASSEFSTSSFTTLAGRSITSPAAILLTTLGGSWRMVGMAIGIGRG